MNRRVRRKRRMVKVSVILALLLVLLAVLFLFQVRKVTVYGNTIHSAEEIQEGLINSVLHKNTLYLHWAYREGSVPDSLPFLKSLKVTMKSPSEIAVEVTEKEPVGYIDQGIYVYFDQEGMVLEFSKKEDDSYPIITGADVDEPVLYQKLPMASSAQLRTILSITQLLNYQELEADEIRFGDKGDITVFVGGVEALLGQDEYLEEKIANLKAILQKLGKEKGTLHLESFTGKSDLTTFTPSDEPETESELPETEASDSSGASSAPEDPQQDDWSDPQQDDWSEPQEDTPTASVVIAMVFDSSGTLIYNVHAENGIVVDSYGNPVSGCTVLENGDVMDAYMNVFDSQTGELKN